MSICAAVPLTHHPCPPNLRSFNPDGSRIDPTEDNKVQDQSQQGSQKVLNDTLRVAEEERKKKREKLEGERRGSGLSGVTLTEDQRGGGGWKKKGVWRRIVGKGEEKGL